MRIAPEVYSVYTDLEPDEATVRPDSFDRWWHRWVDEPARPSPRPAGVWDALLSGHTHSRADRAAADDLSSGAALRMHGWAETLFDFRNRAVTAFADAGCRQWLDLGAGLPTTTSLFYDLCTRSDEHRLVCVDNDSFVIDCIRLHTVHRPRRITVAALPADLTHPDTVAARLPRLAVLDLTRPVTVVAGAVLHHLTDQQAVNALTALRRILVPGSRLIVSHVARVAPQPELTFDHVAAAMQRYHATTAPLYPRTRRQVTSLISAGWTVAPHGLTALTVDTRPELVVGWGLTATATRPRLTARTHR